MAMAPPRGLMETSQPWEQSRSIREGLPWEVLRRRGRWQGRLAVNAGLQEAVHIPVVVVHGASGPSVVLVAGIHGDEFDGGEACRRVLSRLKPERLQGTVVALPVANPLAYRERTRTTPPHVDGVDLARVFPGDPHGSPTERLAHELWGVVVACAGDDGAVIDLHSGGAHYAYARLAGFRTVGGSAEEPSRLLAEAFGFSRVWAMDPVPGTLSTEAALAGLPSIGCEVTGGSRLSSSDVRAYERGIRNVLRRKGVLRDRPLHPRPSAARSASTVVVDHDAFATQLPTLGGRVKRGQQLAVLCDPLGEVLDVVVAPHAGEVWAARICPVMRAGEVLALISPDVAQEQET